MPPVGVAGSGNALQGPVGSTSYTALTDGVSLLPFDVPFAIEGTALAVPEPTTYALLLAGGLAVSGIVRRRRAS